MQYSNISKRKQTALRILSYVAMTISVIVISLICILLILGYRFDAQEGTIEQGGLYQFRSFPSNAVITLDDERLSFRTPGKLNVATGLHTVKMDLNGYQQWTKTTQIKAGELRWLNYARMIPRTITTTPVADFASMADSLPSPDRRWFALLSDATQPVITLYDIRNPDQPRAATLTIPQTAVTAAEGVNHTYSLEEWDFGARYMLVKHTYGDQVEFLKIDRTVPAEAVNLSSTFNLPFSDMHFSGTSGNVFYAQNGTDLRRIDTVAESVTQPLVSNVNSFVLYKSDVLAYIATREDQRVVGVYEDDKESIVRTYDANTPLTIDISSYFDNEYLAVGSNTSLEIIKDPLENADRAGRSFAELTTSQPIGWVEFANSGRFVIAGNGTSISTYDIETDETFSTQFPGVQAADEPLKWLDDFYLYSSANNSLVIREFDGANSHDIAAAAPGYSATLSEDGEYLFSIGKKGEQFVLQSSRMVVSN